MTTLLLFEHRGLAAAVPANQAMSVHQEGREDLPLVGLWDGSSGAPTALSGGPELSAEDHHALLLRTARGRVAVACRELRVEDVPRRTLLPLSALLRTQLRDMPYIVGAAWVHETATWLVDMSRYEG